MRLIVCSVYDSAVGAYLQPFFCRSKGEAIRSFMSACEDKQSNFARFAKDYTLVYFGHWDDQSGEFEPTINARQAIMTAYEAMSQSEGAERPESAREDSVGVSEMNLLYDEARKNGPLKREA